MSLIVIDYGLGNLRSVCRALENVGGAPKLSSDPDEIKSADKIILPGVGAFADGMKGLIERNLVESITSYCLSDRPLLGICLGMQMLFEDAEEFGNHKGLGIIPGVVKKIPEVSASGTPHKVPHIGWSPLIYPEGRNSYQWKDEILSELQENSSVYFVHSYAGVPTDQSHRLADTLYNGQRILAAVKKGSIFGCQFHPEKSGPNGLSILRRFLEI